MLFSVIRSDSVSCAKRGSLANSARRRHFLSWQDCRNIGRRLKDFSKQHHKEDGISVDRIDRELSLETPSPVLAYKPQGIHDVCNTLPDDSDSYDGKTVRRIF